MRVVMLKGTIHACVPDTYGPSWDWDRALQRPVAKVPDAEGERMIALEPRLYGRHPDDAAAVEPARPARGARPRRESP